MNEKELEDRVMNLERGFLGLASVCAQMLEMLEAIYNVRNTLEEAREPSPSSPTPGGRSS